MNITVKSLNDSDSDLSVKYNAHVADIGWQGKTNDVSTWKKDGENAETVGMSKRLEALQIIVVEKGAKINTSLGGIKSVVNQSYVIK